LASLVGSLDLFNTNDVFIESNDAVDEVDLLESGSSAEGSAASLVSSADSAVGWPLCSARSEY